MKRNRSGFTLVEVLVAVVVVALLLSGVYGVFGAVSAARERLEQEGIIYHQARIFFDRIGGELSSMRLSPFEERAVLRAGHTTFGAPYLEFNTELVSPLQRQRGGLSRVRYEARTMDDGSLTLFRSEEMLLAALAPSEALPFITGLTTFEFRYYNQGLWESDWSSNAPPRMIEIFFEAQGADDSVIPFRSSFVLSGGRG